MYTIISGRWTWQICAVQRPEITKIFLFIAKGKSRSIVFSDLCALETYLRDPKIHLRRFVESMTSFPTKRDAFQFSISAKVHPYLRPLNVTNLCCSATRDHKNIFVDCRGTSLKSRSIVFSDMCALEKFIQEVRRYTYVASLKAWHHFQRREMTFIFL